MKRMFISLLVLLILCGCANNTEPELEPIMVHEVSKLESIIYDETFSYDEMLNYLDDNFDEDDVSNLKASYETIQSSDYEVRFIILKMEPEKIDNNHQLETRFVSGLKYLPNQKTPTEILTLGGAHVITSGNKPSIFVGIITYVLETGGGIYHSTYGSVYKNGTIDKGTSKYSMNGELQSRVIESFATSDFIKNISYSQSYQPSKFINK